MNIAVDFGKPVEWWNCIMSSILLGAFNPIEDCEFNLLFMGSALLSLCTFWHKIRGT